MSEKNYDMGIGIKGKKHKRHTLVGLLELRLEGEVLHHIGGFFGSWLL